MLRYLGTGERRYGDRPIPPGRRRWWEFEAVIVGRCAPLLPGREPRPERRRLWLFPPECSHGWTGVAGEPCEIVVFQFPEVPETLAAHARARGHLDIPLDAAACAALRRHGQRAGERLRQPTDRSAIEEEHLLLELSLLALAGLPPRRLSVAERSAEELCERACTWFSARMQDAVGVAEVAEAVHVSVAHLRRLFHQARRLSPQQAFEAERMRRAEELLRDRALSQDAIAAACGFATVQAFSRAFRRQHGVPPGAWLRQGTGVSERQQGP